MADFPFLIDGKPRVILPAELVGMKLKVLTVRQPWATLLAMGIKTFETRGWPTDYRGPLVIHAGKAWKEDEHANARRVHAFIERPGVQDRLAEIYKDVARLPWLDTLGKALAVVNLIDCPQMMTAPDPLEEMFGTFGPDRYGWKCASVCPIVEPITLRGQQGLFEHTF